VYQKGGVFKLIFMGTKEDSTTKPSKTSSSTQEVPTVPPPYPDWSQVVEHMIDFFIIFLLLFKHFCRQIMIIFG
jgi:hypothetical protein